MYNITQGKYIKSEGQDKTLEKKNTLKGGIEEDELAEKNEKQLESRRKTRRV